MQSLLPAGRSVDVEIQAAIERSARSAGLLAGTAHFASPFAPQLRAQSVSQAQEEMLEDLERKFGPRHASRAFWDLRRAVRLAGAGVGLDICDRLLEVSPDRRFLAAALRLERGIRLFSQVLFPLPEAIVIAWAAYHQTRELGQAWADCPVAEALHALAEN